MRIADKMQFDQVRDNLTKNRSEMSGLQNQAATQKRVTKPSDDPVAAARVLSNRVELDGIKQYEKNLKYALGFLEFTDQSLGELTENLVRAKELAIGQANDASANSTSRRVTAAEVGQIYEALVQIGNRKLGDRHIFGGYRTLESPFNLRGQYSGDGGEMMIHIDKGTFVPMNIPGSKIFLGEGMGRDGMTRGTQLQAKNVEELEKQLKAKEDQQRREAFPQQSVPMRGPASVESSLAQNASLQNANGLAPEQGGYQASVESKGLNLFTVLKRMEVGLLTNDKAAIQDNIELLDEAIQQVVFSRAQAGARVMALNNAMDTLGKGKVEIAGQISSLEDADVYKVVSDITQTEGTLKATLETSGKLIQPSLMDFLR